MNMIAVTSVEAHSHIIYNKGYNMLTNAEILRKNTVNINNMYKGRLNENFVYHPLGSLKVNDQFRVAPGSNFFIPDLSVEAQQVMGSMPNLLLTITAKDGSGITVSDATGNNITVPIRDKDNVQVMVLTSQPLQFESRKRSPIRETMSNLSAGDSFSMDGKKFTLVGKDSATPDTYEYRDEDGKKKKMHKDDADKKNINKVKESLVTMNKVEFGESFRILRSGDKRVLTRCTGHGISVIDEQGKSSSFSKLYAKHVKVRILPDHMPESMRLLRRLRVGDTFRFVDNAISESDDTFTIGDMYTSHMTVSSLLSESTRAIFMTQAENTPVMLMGNRLSSVKNDVLGSVNNNMDEDFRPLSDLKVNTYFMLLSATADTNHPLSVPARQLLSYAGSRQLLQVKKSSGSVTVGSAMGIDIVIPPADASRMKVTPLGMNV